MRELGVREFRTEWTKLTGEVVRVQSRGRVLGHWVPGDNPLRWGDEDLKGDQGAQQALKTNEGWDEVVTSRKAQQARRDEILKKMSKQKA